MGQLCLLHRLLAGPVAKIQTLLVIGTIASDLMVRFAAFGRSRRAAVPCWQIFTARITIISVVKMLHGICGAGAITGKPGGQGNGLIATGWKSRWEIHGRRG